MGDLTDRQRDILRWIAAEVLGKGRFPPLRDIGRRFGIASLNGVSCHLDSLAAKGYLVRNARAFSPCAWCLAGARLRLGYDDTEQGRRLREALEGPP